MSHTQQIETQNLTAMLYTSALPTFCFRRAPAWWPSMTGCIVFVSWCKNAFIDAVAFWFSFSCRLRRRTVPLYRSTRPTVAIQVVAPRQHRTTEKAYTWRYNHHSRLTATASSIVKVHMFTTFCFSSCLLCQPSGRLKAVVIEDKFCCVHVLSTWRPVCFLFVCFLYFFQFTYIAEIINFERKYKMK